MKVKISASTLKDMSTSFEEFQGVFENYAKDISWVAHLQPKMVEFRLRDAHQFWVKDLKRVEKAEDYLEDGLDHFKQCGHLAYWLRRTAPVVEFIDMSGHYSDAAHRETPCNSAFRDILYRYGTEYFSFDLAYQICLFHEKTRPDASDRAKNIRLSQDYISTMCHFLKTKNVSPHAIFLIFKSLFI